MVVGRDGRILGRGHSLGVVFVVGAAGDEGRVGQHEADGEVERFMRHAGFALDADAVQVVDCGGGDILIVDLVGGLAGAGVAQADAVGPSRPVQGAAVRAGVADVVGAVVADEAIRVSVQLVGAEGVHSAGEDGAIAGSTQCVGESRDAGVEDVLVGPDFILVGKAARQHGHA